MASTLGAAASSYVKAAAHHAVNAVVSIHLEGRADNDTIATDTKVIPEEDYHKSRVFEVNFSCWFLTALAALFLGLRIYCKKYRGRGLWWDDYVLVISWVCHVVFHSFVKIPLSHLLGAPLPIQGVPKQTNEIQQPNPNRPISKPKKKEREWKLTKNTALPNNLLSINNLQRNPRLRPAHLPL